MIQGTNNLCPSHDTHLGWTATQVAHFALHGQEIFALFIPDGQENHPVWVCLQKHLQYFTLLMQTSYSKNDVKTIDVLIYSQQQLFLSIPQYYRCAHQ